MYKRELIPTSGTQKAQVRPVSDLPTTIEKKGAVLLPKIEFSPSNPTSEKIIASFKVFS